MKADLFVEMDEYIKRANGATDPEVVAACNNILVAKPLSGSIIGMAMSYSTLAVVSGALLGPSMNSILFPPAWITYLQHDEHQTLYSSYLLIH